MQNANKIQLGNPKNNIDAAKASRSIRAMPGKVVVEMLPPTTMHGELHLPETVGADLRFDIGVVVSQPFSTRLRGIDLESPSIGTTVCVVGYDGCWVDGLETPSYQTSNEIRTYGHFCEFEGQPVRVDWWESIPCSIDEAMNLTAYGDKVIIRRDAEINKIGNIILPDSAVIRAANGTVVSVGKLVDGIKAGDRVCYDPRAIEQSFDLVDGLKDCVIMQDTGINFVIPYEH